MKKTCNVKGVSAKGAMCGFVIVSSNLCGIDGACVHQQLVSDTLEKLVPTISEFADTNPGIPITADRTIDSLGLDKLDILMFTMAVEEDFDIAISDSDMDECKTVGDIVNLIDKGLAKC